MKRTEEDDNTTTAPPVAMHECCREGEREESGRRAGV
jgi:hypothetical protein